MGKYVYSKKCNKIFQTKWFKKSNGWYKEIYEPHFGGSWDDIDFEIKDSIEFDNFTDLIEVGDLIMIEDEYVANIKDIAFEVVVNIDEQHKIETRNYYNINNMVIEIWKRIGNTFKRICHKKDGNWVID